MMFSPVIRAPSSYSSDSNTQGKNAKQCKYQSIINDAEEALVIFNRAVAKLSVIQEARDIYGYKHRQSATPETMSWKTAEATMLNIVAIATKYKVAEVQESIDHHKRIFDHFTEEERKRTEHKKKITSMEIEVGYDSSCPAAKVRHRPDYIANCNSCNTSRYVTKADTDDNLFCRNCFSRNIGLQDWDGKVVTISSSADVPLAPAP